MSAAQLKEMRGPKIPEGQIPDPGYITKAIPNRLNKAVEQLVGAPGADHQIVLNVHEPSTTLTQRVLDNMQRRATDKGLGIQVQFSDGMNLIVRPA